MTHFIEVGGKPGEDAAKPRQEIPDMKDYPVRDYVAAMSVELAEMARWDGDERLACVLEAAAAMAREPRDP